MSFLGLFSRSHRRRQRARRRLAVTVVTLLGLGAMAMAASAYSRLYVFGETLSDVRNLLAAAGIVSPPATSGTFDGSFGPSNPVWAEDLAAHLGLQADPFTPGGTHTDVGSLPGNMDGVLPEGFSLPSIAAQIAAAGAPDPNGLYVIAGPSAGSFAGGFGGATVVASTSTAPGFSFGGSPLTTPLSFDQPPVIFGLPPGGQFVPSEEDDPACTGDCPQPETQFVCNEPCVPLPPTLSPGCTQNCDQLPPEQCLVNCTTPTNACTENCAEGPPNGRTPAITAEVPEPATIAVILLGLGALVVVRQRRPVWTRRRSALARRG